MVRLGAGSRPGSQPDDLALHRANGKIRNSTDLACPRTVRHDDPLGANALAVGELYAGYPTVG
jgi:hypothetical protein